MASDKKVSARMYKLLTIIEANNQDEREAIKNYWELLHAFEELRPHVVAAEAEGVSIGISVEFLDTMIAGIRDNIAEEMKHSKRLDEYDKVISGLVPEKF